MCSKWLAAGTAVVLAGSVPFAANGQDGSRAESARAVDSGTCETGASRAKTETTTVFLTQEDFTTVPGTQIRFRQGARGCVIVLFTSEAVASAGTGVVVRAVMDDGARIATPPYVYFAREDTSLQARSFAFMFKNVPAGTRRVLIQGSRDGNGSAALEFRTTVVFYTP
jgi:hypothetical protein